MASVYSDDREGHAQVLELVRLRTDLVDHASETTEDVVHLYDFTQQLLHNHLTETEKARIVGLLWQVAYADGRLDKYEDSLVLKISDLLYVGRGRVMRLKHDAEIAANS